MLSRSEVCLLTSCVMWLASTQVVPAADESAHPGHRSGPVRFQKAACVIQQQVDDYRG